MQHFYNEEKFGENWFTYPKLYSWIVSFVPNNSHIVEVGSWKGKSSVYMAVEIINSGKKINFDCVDTWLGSAEHKNNLEVIDDTLYEIFISNISRVKDQINPVRLTSYEASKLYKDKSLDFVFIDADHSYESVKMDINLWLPKVKCGGVLAGHDYRSGWPDVDRAVDEIFKNVKHSEQCWILNI